MTGTSRWGTIEWGAGAAPAPAGAILDAVNSYNDALYRLGFGSAAEVTSVSWVTAAELYQWADEAVKRIAYASGIFLTWDTSLTAVALTPVYALATNNVFVEAVWLAGAPLRITAVRDLWALDANWVTTTGSPTRASMDASGPATLTLYANPLVGGALGLIAQEFPAAAIVAGASTLALPTVLQDWITDAMIAGARGKESDSAMHEIAEHMQERMRLYEAVIDKYYGGGQ